MALLAASVPAVDSLTCSKYCRVFTTRSRKTPPQPLRGFSATACNPAESWSSSVTAMNLYNKKGNVNRKDNIKSQLLPVSKTGKVVSGEKDVKRMQTTIF